MTKRVLFVSWTSRTDQPFYDPSVRYRCYNVARELIKRGFMATVVAQAKMEKNCDLYKGYDAYVFHRPYMTEALAGFMLEMSRDQIAIADFDDLIFDIKHAALTPSVRVKGQALAAVQKYLSRNFFATQLFSKITVSTVALAEHAKRLFPSAQVAVVHNSAEDGFLGLCRTARSASAWDERHFDLGYFSGTATHDKDLEIAAGAIAARLTRGGRMLLVGPVKMPLALQGVADRIETSSLVPFQQLPRLMAKCKTVIAPLEDNYFTRSKSGLKFFEAALAGCEVAATPIPDIDRFNSPLLTKCTDDIAWSHALNSESGLDEHTREQEIRKVEQSVCSAAETNKWLKFSEL